MGRLVARKGRGRTNEQLARCSFIQWRRWSAGWWSAGLHVGWEREGQGSDERAACPLLVHPMAKVVG